MEGLLTVSPSSSLGETFFVEAASVLPFITVIAIAAGPEGHCAASLRCLLSPGEYSVGREDNQINEDVKCY